MANGKNKLIQVSLTESIADFIRSQEVVEIECDNKCRAIKTRFMEI